MSNLETNNENHNYTVVMNCNYQSLEIEKCSGCPKSSRSQSDNSVAWWLVDAELEYPRCAFIMYEEHDIQDR